MEIKKVLSEVGMEHGAGSGWQSRGKKLYIYLLHRKVKGECTLLVKESRKNDHAKKESFRLFPFPAP